MHSRRLAFFAMIAAGLAAPASADLSIPLQSGNGSVPGMDTSISMLVGPANAAFPFALGAAEFAAASAGPQAFIINPHAAWKPHLGSNPSAEWISTNANGAAGGSTGLYAIDFMVTEAFQAATLNFDFLIDNDLGDALNEGLFINGQPLSGSKLIGTQVSFFQVDQSFPTFDITSMLSVGVNTLYINAVDHGGPSGLQFSATINTVIPVPGAALLGMMGLGMVGWVRRRIA